MNARTNIQQKEQSLAELMGRLFREPLNPLEEMLKETRDEILDARDDISENNNSIHVAIAQSEECNKSIRRLKNDIIQKTGETGDKTVSDLTARLDSSVQGVMNQLREAEKQTDASLLARKKEILDAISSIRIAQDKMSGQLLEQHTELESRISVIHTGMKISLILSGVTLLLVLAHVLFDLWSRFG